MPYFYLQNFRFIPFSLLYHTFFWIANKYFGNMFANCKKIYIPVYGPQRKKLSLFLVRQGLKCYNGFVYLKKSYLKEAFFCLITINHQEARGFLSKIKKYFRPEYRNHYFWSAAALYDIQYDRISDIWYRRILSGHFRASFPKWNIHRLAIREESIYKADSDGFITYYAREGNKINANGPVYGISSSKATENSAELTPEELTSIRNDMMSFSKGFNPSKFNNTYSFKYTLEGNILQYAGTSEGGAVSLGGQAITKADSDGIVLYSMDGYENKAYPLYPQWILIRMLTTKLIWKQAVP